MSLFPRTAGDGFLPALPRVGVAFAAVSAMTRTFTNRRAAHRIADLPDHLLTDIGLRRDDVHAALSINWREDPTYQLAVRAAGRRRGQ